MLYRRAVYKGVPLTLLFFPDGDIGVEREDGTSKVEYVSRGWAGFPMNLLPTRWRLNRIMSRLAKTPKPPVSPYHPLIAEFVPYEDFLRRD